MSERYPKSVPVSPDNPAIEKDEDICANCSHCLAVCAEEIGVAQPCKVTGADDFTCIHCGQCAAACPERAIRAKSQWREAAMAVNDPQKIVIFSTAPSVRVGLGECFGGKPGDFVESYMVSALRKLGADFVLDVAFSADLTIMEEGTEFLKRFIADSHPLPQFTSCCPAWVKFCENRYPQFRKNLSTCRSPQAMFGALLKEEARTEEKKAAQEGTKNRKTVVISIMPCTAKKAEIKRPEHFTEGKQDVDYVLTTTEVTRMIQEAGIDLSRIEPEALDMPFGLSSGAGAIFGVTGGVTEAVLRRLKNNSSSEVLDAISFTGIRGVDGIKEASVDLNGREVKIAVVNGLHCAKELLDRMKDGEVHYDFVEVMACKRGCIAGGGQPVPIGPRTKKARLEGIYKIDSMAQIKLSNENPIVATVYNGILKGKEHKLLHNPTVAVGQGQDQE